MSRVRRRREELGLSQAELAAAAGLSRPLVGTVETGRHVPSVNAALALARALETTVEELFGAPVKSWEPALGREAREGAPVVALRVGDRLVYAPVPEGPGGDFWQRADGVYEGGRVKLFTGPEPEGFAVAGCDPALGLAASLLAQSGPVRLVAVPATSAEAGSALAKGRLHAALIHGPAGRLPAASGAVVRLPLARWQVGLAGGAGVRIDLERVAAGEALVARLASGAEAQRALERALGGRSEASRITGPVAGGHLEAARLVSYGVAEFGVVMEPAARAYRLQFLPLEEHIVILEVPTQWAEHPGARALTDLFASKPFVRRLAVVGGYELPAS